MVHPRGDGYRSSVHTVLAPRSNEASVKDLRGLLDSDEDAWKGLAQRAAVANPFFESACALDAAERLGDDGARLIQCGDTHHWDAALPIQLIRSRRAGVALRVAHTRGLSTAVGLGTPLVDASCVEEGLRRLVGACVQWSRDGGPGVVVLDWFDEDRADMGRMLRDSCHSLGVPVWVQRTWDRPVILRKDDGLSLETGLSSRRRHEVRRKRKRLEEILGADVKIVDRASDPAAVEEFLRLEASGWKGDYGDAYLRTPAKADWFRSLCRNFAALNRLHLISIVVNERTIAMQCHLRSGPEAYLLRIAHDAALNQYGLGVLLHVKSVDYLSTKGVDLVDTCASPGDPFLGEIYTDRRRLSTFVLGVGGPVPRALVRLSRAMEPLGTLVKPRA